MNQPGENNDPGYAWYPLVVLLIGVVILLVLHFLTPTTPSIFNKIDNML